MLDKKIAFYDIIEQLYTRLYKMTNRLYDL